MADKMLVYGLSSDGKRFIPLPLTSNSSADNPPVVVTGVGMSLEFSNLPRTGERGVLPVTNLAGNQLDVWWQGVDSNVDYSTPVYAQFVNDIYSNQPVPVSSGASLHNVRATGQGLAAPGTTVTSNIINPYGPTSQILVDITEYHAGATLTFHVNGVSQAGNAFAIATWTVTPAVGVTVFNISPLIATVANASQQSITPIVGSVTAVVGGTGAGINFNATIGIYTA